MLITLASRFTGLGFEVLGPAGSNPVKPLKCIMRQKI
jgi:hypothetical protein